MNFRPLLLLTVFLGFLHHGHCSTNVTLAVPEYEGIMTKSLSVSTGQVARVVSAYLAGGCALRLAVSGSVFDVYRVSGGVDPSVKLPIVLVGPATVTLRSVGDGLAISGAAFGISG